MTKSNGSQNFLLHSIFIHFFCFTFFCCNSRIVGKSDHNYQEALSKSILFFEGQRSGKLPPTQRMSWRGDSALYDGKSTANVDLTGGYYDAGDNVKFNFPMAFTTTMLSWSVIEFGGRMAKTGELKNAREAIKWATDYLLKTASKVKSDNRLFAGIANPTLDHNCWERPEDMDTDRSVYSVTTGSDLAGEVAAALAAASLVFRKVNSTYSKQLRNTADDVMQFAIKYPGKYSDQLSNNVCPFYCSYSGFKDELLWGAAWLYKATKSTYYRNYILSYGGTDETDAFGWDSKFPGAYVLLAREYLVSKDDDFKKFNGKAETFMCKILRDSPYRTIQFSPGGMMYSYNLPDSPLQYVTGLSFLITTYAKYIANKNAQTHTIVCGGRVFNTKYLRDQAQSQMDYILGTNPKKMSYMVGYGERCPERVHHRAASSPKVKAHPEHIQCGLGFALYLHTNNINPNVLTGAIVGGPNGNDEFEDVRDKGQTEPTTYTNAAIVGTLAYFAAKQ
ncbi:hypothetical protein CASFOL_016473 [Castilleja foliolosa]|uniref:cellulase n=1 Tax=Castilleja foliolosa TaxID=1961234 RepID=A0ABD3DGQ1_9LAMI